MMIIISLSRSADALQPRRPLRLDLMIRSKLRALRRATDRPVVVPVSALHSADETRNRGARATPAHASGRAA